MNILFNENGIKAIELKKWLDEYLQEPVVESYLDEEGEVWVDTDGGLSNVAVSISPLNRKDIIISPDYSGKSPMNMLIEFYDKCGLKVGKTDIFRNPAEPPIGYMVSIEVGMAEFIQGYNGFTTQFFFDLDGNFKYQKIWE